MTEEVKQDAGEAPAQETEAVAQDDAKAGEFSEKTKALYLSFVKAALEIDTTNTMVAKASILLLTDALANMGGANRLPQPLFDDVIGRVIDNIEAVAIALSHELAAVVTQHFAPPEEQAAMEALADTDMTVEH